MKRFNEYLIIFSIFLTYTYANNTLLFTPKDTNSTLESTENVSSAITLPKKRKESLYKKFERKFSDYDDTFFKNVLLYPVDIMMPDEFLHAGKDVLKNRDKKGFDGSRTFPKTLGNDFYNLFLTIGYYYMEDIARITDGVWSKAICSPDIFKYDPNLEPKEVAIRLKESDVNARGVTEHGIVLPVNPNFPDARYPYAQKPNGCSTEELEYLYDLSNTLSDDEPWLSKACDAHDRCYYTEGTTYQECNSKLIIDTIDSCRHITNKKPFFF